MKKPYDILIVGSGMFGATCAYELSSRGRSCLVLERRAHIGGNCYTEERDGINLHKYGAHIFHTSNRVVWDWINQFAHFNHYRHHLKVNYNGSIFSFPINLLTLHQLWGVRTPEDAGKRLAQVRVPMTGKDNLETWILSQIGPEIYDIFIKGYTRKQWGRNPADLPASIVKRIPIRLTYDDNYFSDLYQGIPIGGYTQIFSRLLSQCDVRLNTDYLQQREEFDSIARKVLYTGPLDAFFGYCFGRLEYRGLRFEHERIEALDFQGVSVMNYTSEHVPFTRILEHKHFEFGKQPVTWITREYPVDCSVEHDPIYPTRDQHSRRIFDRYFDLRRTPAFGDYYFGGRLAQYRYFDMHQVIGAALKKAKQIENDFRTKG